MISPSCYSTARGRTTKGTVRPFTLIVLLAIASSAFAQSIVTREEADHIFNLARPQWEAYAQRVHPPPRWAIEVKPLDTGSRLEAVARLRGIVISMQPFYDNASDPPGMLIVGSAYPRGTHPELTEKRRRDLEAEVAAELGVKYSVLISFKQTGLVEGFDIILTEKAIAQNL